MTLNIAINGFGRIGRMVTRALLESGRSDMVITAVNDLGAAKDNAHLFKYDSIHGTYPRPVAVTPDGFDLGAGTIKVFAEKDPSKLPWGALNIDIVMECSGVFTAREKAAVHLTAGAKRVMVSAPSDGADATIVYGVNHNTLAEKHLVISNGSCTTNCLAPVIDVLHKNLGIKHGFMTTVHSYTGDQKLVDSLHKDLRRARAAAQSLIPSSTGAAKALHLVIPEMKGKLDGTSIRVPTPNVSLIDLTVVVERDTSTDEINKMMHDSANGYLRGVLAVEGAELVSSDFNHNPASASFDTTQTQVVDKRFVRVLAWYDNEWGFSNRMLDTAAAFAKTFAVKKAA